MARAMIRLACSACPAQSIERTQNHTLWDGRQAMDVCRGGRAGLFSGRASVCQDMTIRSASDREGEAVVMPSSILGNWLRSELENGRKTHASRYELVVSVSQQIGFVWRFFRIPPVFSNLRLGTSNFLTLALMLSLGPQFLLIRRPAGSGRRQTLPTGRFVTDQQIDNERTGTGRNDRSSFYTCDRLGGFHSRNLRTCTLSPRSRSE